MPNNPVARVSLALVIASLVVVSPFSAQAQRTATSADAGAS